MRKIFLTLVHIFSFAAMGNCQNAYYDALKLRSYIVMDATGNPRFVVPIAGDPNEAQQKAQLIAYCNLINTYYQGSLTTPRQVHLALGTIGQSKYNPFLADYLTPSAVLSASTGTLETTRSTGLLSKIGNLDVTNIADGLARFIVERTKKELQSAFFDRFIEEMKKDAYKDIRTLFPYTYLVALRIGDNVYNTEVYLQSFREAFGKDLENILPNLETVMTNGKFVPYFDQHLELKSVCLTAFHFGKGLQKGRPIGLILEEYDAASSKYIFNDTNVNIIKNNAIKFMQEVSASFRTATPNSTEYWVPSDSIKQLVNDPIALNIYLGLVHAKVNALQIYKNSTTNYGTVLAEAKLADSKLKEYLQDITSLIENVQSFTKELNSKPSKERTVNDYIAYFNSATKLMMGFSENELTRSVYQSLPNNIQADFNKFWNSYIKTLDATNAVLSIYTSLKDRNYSLVIANVHTLYSMRYEPALARTAAAKDSVSNIIDFLLEKGAFIAGVAEAKNSQEVYEAINAVAMPAGSARVKRLSFSNIALNAYCGLFIGKEKIQGVNEDNKFINAYGLTAPIGFSFSRGNRVLPWPFHNIFEAKGWSSTIFVSVIDLGAVAAYRFSNETAEAVPTIQLKDIFSPGLFWSVGVPKAPLSFNLGVQVGPNLRKVTNTTNDYSNNTYLRYSFSVCVDLPLLNLHTKSR